MPAPSRGLGSGTLVVFGVAVILNLILTVLLLHQVDGTRKDVESLKGELASKQDVAMLRPIRVRDILERNCTTCHTDRRFAATLNMSEPQVLATIQRMRSHPGADIPAEQVRRIEAALLAFRCTSCHGEAVLSKLVLMPPDERGRFLRKKVAMPGSGFRPDQVSELISAFQILSGEDG